MTNKVYHCEALVALHALPDASIDLIYTDPPFGTQIQQVSHRRRCGKVISFVGYDDKQIDYMAWIKPHLNEFKRVLKPTGTLYLHMDWHWVHYVKIALDEIFGRDCFLNEVVWAYDFGGRGKRSWPKKHDTILVFSREKDKHVFNWDDIDRVPYAAPEMQRVGRSVEEAERRIAAGKVPTDVWFMSIVGTQAKERTGYPNQKPVKLIERAVLASSPQGGVVLDPFAGSGTTGMAALLHDRSFILSDVSSQAIEVMKERFKEVSVEWM